MTLDHDLARAPLMRGIEEGEQVADRDRFDALGYQLVDNINRVINKAPISNPSTPIYVVDKTNIDKFGGKLGTFTPGNGFKKHFLELWKTGKTS